MTDLTLNARQKKLLSILNARHNVETGKELAAKLGVSERTVRNDIRAINSKLKQYEIQILPQYGKGYTISVNNRVDPPPNRFTVAIEQKQDDDNREKGKANHKDAF